ncbi:hypothetical protein I312_100242 [Cryptococcus bacillisporus CA1280]|uniref:uncharacterized protein n=1 Tax=Cryptococcus bacillisporus CA1280 TaxID=1296109 RepID=UPI003365F12C
MFRPAIARPAASLARPLARTFVSRATFVGRLGTAPEKSTTSAGQPYYKYPLAVSKPPKRDADGKVILDEGGYPVRADPSWFTIFNFNERAEARIESLVPGSLLYVEANIDTITSPAAADGAPGTKQYVFREVSHKVLSKPRQE